MPAVPAIESVRIVRPLLDVPRTEIEHYATLRGLSFVEDPSNIDVRCCAMRSGVRSCRRWRLPRARHAQGGGPVDRPGGEAAEVLREYGSADLAACSAGAPGGMLAWTGWRCLHLRARHLSCAAGLPNMASRAFAGTLARPAGGRRSRRRADARLLLRVGALEVRRHRGLLLVSKRSTPPHPGTGISSSPCQVSRCDITAERCCLAQQQQARWSAAPRARDLQQQPRISARRERLRQQVAQACPRNALEAVFGKPAAQDKCLARRCKQRQPVHAQHAAGAPAEHAARSAEPYSRRTSAASATRSIDRAAALRMPGRAISSAGTTARRIALRRQPHVDVARIFDERQTAQRCIVLDLVRGTSSKGRTMRTDSIARHRRIARVFQAGTAQPLDQERLDTIVEMMRGKDQARRVLVGGVKQGGVTSHPRCGFGPARLRPHGHASYIQRYFELGTLRGVQNSTHVSAAFCMPWWTWTADQFAEPAHALLAQAHREIEQSCRVAPAAERDDQRRGTPHTRSCTACQIGGGVRSSGGIASTALARVGQQGRFDRIKASGVVSLNLP